MRRKMFKQLWHAEPDGESIESALIGAILVLVMVVAAAQIGLSLMPVLG